jgi:phosphoribosylformimino-5-aminoimidazole carboxamide ribotide isomerase
MNGWKTLTDMTVTAGKLAPCPVFATKTTRLTLPSESIAQIERYCSELLIHAADVEGLCQGIDEELVRRKSRLYNCGAWC